MQESKNLPDLIHNIAKTRLKGQAIDEQVRLSSLSKLF